MNTKETNPKEAIGVKKIPLSVVPTAVLMEVSVAMLEGAAKYGRHNYREAGGRASIYYDATMRHLNKWWELGEDIDPDSKLHHITKAISSLMVLRDVMIQDKFVDDRPPASLLDYEALEKIASKLVENAPEGVKHFTQNNAKRQEPEFVTAIDGESFYSIELNDSYVYLDSSNKIKYMKGEYYEFIPLNELQGLMTKSIRQTTVSLKEF